MSFRSVRCPVSSVRHRPSRDWSSKYTRGDELRPVELVGARIEFAVFSDRLAAEHREPLGVALAQNFDDFGMFIGKPEVTLVDYQCVAERIDDSKERHIVAADKERWKASLAVGEQAFSWVYC